MLLRHTASLLTALTLLILTACSGDPPEPATSPPAGSADREAVETSAPATAESGAERIPPSVRQNVVEGEFWTIQGKLVDYIRLDPLAGGTVQFSYGALTIDAPVNEFGWFRAELPALRNGKYLVAVEPPEGYEPHPRLGSLGSFEEKSFEERLANRTGIPFQSGIEGSQSDLEIGLVPTRLTPEEEQAYYEYIRKYHGSGY